MNTVTEYSRSTAGAQAITHRLHYPKACCCAVIRCIILVVPHLKPVMVWAGCVQHLWRDYGCPAMAFDVHNCPDFKAHCSSFDQATHFTAIEKAHRQIRAGVNDVSVWRLRCDSPRCQSLDHGRSHIATTLVIATVNISDKCLDVCIS